MVMLGTGCQKGRYPWNYVWGQLLMNRGFWVHIAPSWLICLFRELIWKLNRTFSYPNPIAVQRINMFIAYTTPEVFAKVSVIAWRFVSFHALHVSLCFGHFMLLYFWYNLHFLTSCPTAAPSVYQGFLIILTDKRFAERWSLTCSTVWILLTAQ